MNKSTLITILCIAMTLTILCAEDTTSINPLHKKQSTLLKLAKKKIKTIANFDAIQNPHMIIDLDLSHNELDTLDLNILTVFPNLKHVWVNNNKIQRIIPLKKGYTLPSLRFINIAYNALNNFTSASFNGCPALEELWLNHNNIDTIDTLIPLNNLRELHLNNNHLSALWLADFATFPWLYILNVGFNQIESIHTSSIPYQKLEVLYLNNNILKIVPDYAFTPMQQLKVLYAQDNVIETLQPRCFVGLYNLIQLLIYNNRITHIPHNTFSDMHTLYILYLRNNMLKTVEPECFSGLDNLGVLDLLHNQLNEHCLRDTISTLSRVPLIYS